MTNAYLLVLSEREALAWVLRTQSMAFPTLRRAEVRALNLGDALFLLTTRGCFHNPGRDRTRIIGMARVASQVTAVDEPIVLAGRTFTAACAIDVQSLTPYLTGVEVRPLVPHLAAFPNESAWFTYLRRPLVRLASGDVETIQSRLDKVSVSFDEALTGYLANIRPVSVQSPRTRHK